MSFLRVSGIPITVNLPFFVSFLRKKCGKGKFWVYTLETISETASQVANIKFDNFDDLRNARNILHGHSFMCKGKTGTLQVKIIKDQNIKDLFNKKPKDKSFTQSGPKKNFQREGKRQIYDELFNQRKLQNDDSFIINTFNPDCDQLNLNPFDDKYKYEFNMQINQDPSDDLFENYRQHGKRQKIQHSLNHFGNKDNRQIKFDSFVDQHESNRQMNLDTFDDYRQRNRQIERDSVDSFRQDANRQINQGIIDNYRHEGNGQMNRVLFNNFSREGNRQTSQHIFVNAENRQIDPDSFDNYRSKAIGQVNPRQTNLNSFDNHRREGNRQTQDDPFDNFVYDGHQQINQDVYDNYEIGHDKSMDPDSFDNYRSKGIRQLEPGSNNVKSFERDMFKNEANYSKSRIDSHNEAEKLEIEIQILRKQRLIVEEERKLLLEKKKLEMLKESSPRQLLSSGHIDARLSRRNPVRDAPKSVPGITKLKVIPQFLTPVKELMKQMKKVIDECCRTCHGKQKSVLMTLIRNNIRKKIAVIVDKKDYYMSSAEIVTLYRKMHPASTDDKFVKQQLQIAKQATDDHAEINNDTDKGPFRNDDHIAFVNRGPKEEIFQDKSASDYWNENV